MRISFYNHDCAEDYIELSDRRVFWECNIDDPVSYDIYVRIQAKKFEQKYNTKLYLLGRNGRHVCVENTPKNRQQFYNMQRTANKLIDELVIAFK